MFEMIPVLFTIGVIFFSGLVVLFGFSALEFFFRIKRKGIRMQGTIVHIDRTLWGVKPLMCFKDQEGNEIEAMPKNFKRGKNTMYREGDKVVNLLYSKRSRNLRVDSGLWKIILVMLIMIIGAGISLTTIFSLILD